MQIFDHIVLTSGVKIMKWLNKYCMNQQSRALQRIGGSIDNKQILTKEKT
tara:strand:+ start:238 stop:387 length:150 start_codon:yes stop_codon:yes gene_type:complete